MIDADALLADAKALASLLVDDLRERTEADDATRLQVRGTYDRARHAGRTDKTYNDWREDLLAQVASAWVLACVFVRFCEDNGLVDTPQLGGPGERETLARDHRAAFFAADPSAGDREWLEHVFAGYSDLPGVADVFGDRNPLWQAAPSADGARALLELWWKRDDEGRGIVHDFTDPQLDTRFLGDLYQDLSEHAKKTFALLQTPDFVESFILDYTLNPAIETFGLSTVRMIDPTCGSGHFLLGAFDRLFTLWQEREPATPATDLAQRALDAVNGVDLNPFAVAIARFRLLVAACKASGVTKLRGAPDFHINVATGDSLLHGTRADRLLTGASEFDGVLGHHYPTEDAAEADRILQANSYHAVVGNPPYITVKDKALNAAYRSLYSACHRQYALTVPFAQRFHDLAVPEHGGGKSRPTPALRRIDPPQEAGYIGQITSNSFMKRQFGTKFIEEFLTGRDLTHVIDTSGAYIPGHGTPTVILLSRDRSSRDPTRAVLSIRGEPGRPSAPAEGKVWLSIVEQVDRPGSESEFISVEDLSDGRLDVHPWSLQGGAAPTLTARIEQASRTRLATVQSDMGYGAVTREDDAYLIGRAAAERQCVQPEHIRPLSSGSELRNWLHAPVFHAVWPYDPNELTPSLSSEEARLLWPLKSRLSDRVAYGKTQLERGLYWFEYSMFFVDRFREPLSIAFAFVATHNHFVVDRGGKVFNRSAPVLKLPEGASEEKHLALLGLLNSAVACFWMKQVFHSKGSQGINEGMKTEAWERFYEFDSTKLKQFPIPDHTPTEWARLLDTAAQELGAVLPAAVAEREAPTAEALNDAAKQAQAIRSRMVALQEELDWACYGLYGLLNNVAVKAPGTDVHGPDHDATVGHEAADAWTLPPDRIPDLARGDRAFEIALARRMAAGEASSTWFERHGSTPITELPDHWPADYRALVKRRLQLIEADRAIKLLERPEHKRRWNWDELADLGREAQERWLLDRLEDWVREQPGDQPEPTTVARLADRLSAAPNVRAVAEDLEGTGADLVKLVDRLVRSAGVPYAPELRFKPSGMRKYADWLETWRLQRIEDDLEARTKLPPDDPNHLDEQSHALARKEASVDDIPVPPKYKKSDYRDDASWKLRGKLDVPKERFITYPGTKRGADPTLVLGWAGWNHLEQAQALASLYTSRKEAGADPTELKTLLNGLADLVPWLQQWHNDPDPTYGDCLGDAFAAFIVTQTSDHDSRAGTECQTDQ